MSASHEKRARNALVTAGVSSAAGVAIAGTFSRTLGGVIVVAGWLMFVYALHAFGRAASIRD